MLMDFPFRTFSILYYFAASAYSRRATSITRLQLGVFKKTDQPIKPKKPRKK
jgi:hypothetical protein